MNRALLELQGAAHLRRGVLPLCGHLSDLQSVNVGSYVQSCCYHKFAQVPHCIAPIADNARSDHLSVRMSFHALLDSCFVAQCPRY